MENGSTIQEQLIEAVENGNYDGVIEAIRDGADVLTDFSAMNAAVKNGHCDIAEHLLNFSFKREDRQYAIYLSAVRGQNRMLGIVNSAPSNKNNAIYQAASEGYTHILTELLKKAGDFDPDKCFLVAARNGHHKCVEILLPLCRPENSSANADGLSWAALVGHMDIVKLLCKHFDPKGFSSRALQWAANNRQYECVKYLIPLSNSDEAIHGLKRINHTEAIDLIRSVSQELNLKEKHSEVTKLSRTQGI